MSDQLTTANGQFRVNDSGLIVTPSVGANSFSSTAVDGVGVEIDSSGKLSLKAKGIVGDDLGVGAGRRIVKLLSASTGAAGALSVTHATGSDLWIMDAYLVISTASGAVTIDIGVAATAVSADTLFDGVSCATVQRNAFQDGGTNGKVPLKWPSGYYLTGTWSGAPGAPVVYLVATVMSMATEVNVT